MASEVEISMDPSGHWASVISSACSFDEGPIKCSAVRKSRQAGTLARQGQRNWNTFISNLCVVWMHPGLHIAPPPKSRESLGLLGISVLWYSVFFHSIWLSWFQSEGVAGCWATGSRCLVPRKCLIPLFPAFKLLQLSLRRSNKMVCDHDQCSKETSEHLWQQCPSKLAHLPQAGMDLSPDVEY